MSEVRVPLVESRVLIDRLLFMANIGRKEAAHLAALCVTGQSGTTLKIDAMADALTEAAVFIEKIRATA